jgi:hypothetical protein
MTMACFYEIRSADNTAMKRDGGFASRDTVEAAAREDGKKLKNSRLANRPDVGRILAGRNTENTTRC